jgi:hypothetical protein
LGTEKEKGFRACTLFGVTHGGESWGQRKRVRLTALGQIRFKKVQTRLTALVQ